MRTRWDTMRTNAQQGGLHTEIAWELCEKARADSGIQSWGSLYFWQVPKWCRGCRSVGHGKNKIKQNKKTQTSVCLSGVSVLVIIMATHHFITTESVRGCDSWHQDSAGRGSCLSPQTAVPKDETFTAKAGLSFTPAWTGSNCLPRT